MSLSDADLAFAVKNLDRLSPVQKEQVLHLLDERKRLADIKSAREHFIPFIQRMWPGIIIGAHHHIIAEHFEELLFGKLNRLIINIAPRHGKSELTSWLLPLWYLGLNPGSKVMQCMNSQDLAAGFGRRVRNSISKEAIATELKGADPYHEIFPNMDLSKDSGAANHWHDITGSEYYAVGTGGRIAGRGASLLVIDDPHALSTSTEIPTPEGFKTIKELQVGDEVYGPDGKPTKVLAKSPIYEDRELYRVTTNDGASIYADAAHLWSYRSGTNTALPFVTGRTDDLATWGKPNLPVLPSINAPEFPERKLPIDPYLLGVWLGNGTATLGRITSHQDDVAWFRAQFDAAGYETTDQADERNFGVLGLRAQLIDMDLYDNKHIPEAYLIASPAQRLALLQGLMDTDGHVSEKGGCSFDNTNTDLIDGVQELVRSFGVRAIFKRFEGSNRKAENATIYRVNFSMANACRLPRKRARLKAEYGKRGRSITVTSTGYRGRVQCITVDREDGLFLAGRGYVVTHNSEQEAKLAESNPAIFDSVYDWYVFGPRQRLQPNAKICVVQTRWSKRDLTGRLLKKMKEDDSPVADKWKVINFEAILDEGQPTERSLWPGFWPLETLQATRAALPVSAWQSQYQQNPVSEGAALFKREHWRIWGKDTDADILAHRSSCPAPQHRQAWNEGDPPACKLILHSWDPATTKNERSHPSGFTAWGIFEVEDPATGRTIDNIILLSAFKQRMEFPELKKKVKEFYDEDRPDILLIENKAAGMQLLQEFRSMGLPVESHQFGRGKSTGIRGVGTNDKISRANGVVDVFASGFVWAPERRFAETVIEQMAEFPNSDEDDLLDSAVQAMIRFRAGGFIRTANDEAEDDEPRVYRRKRMY